VLTQPEQDATSQPEGALQTVAGLAARQLLAAAAVATWLWGADRLAARVLADAPIGMRWEATWALWGGHAFTGVALLGATMLIAAAWFGTRWLPPTEEPRTSKAWGAGAAAALCTIYPAWLAARSLLAGDWISQQSWAGVLRSGVIAAVAGVALVLGGLAFAQWSNERRRMVFMIACAAGAVAAAIADATVLPGLYPAMHFALYYAGAALAFVPIGYALSKSPLVGRASLAAGGGALLLLAGGCASWFTMPLRTRAAVSLASPYAQEMVPLTTSQQKQTSLSAVLASLDVGGGSLIEPRDADATSKLTGGRSDWNVVFIVVDTLRSDTVSVGRKRGGVSEDGDTPFLDEWLSTAYRFRFAYSQASRTKASMPPTFRSCEPYENPLEVGEPLAVRFANLGLEPVAVVPQYFLMPIEKSSQNLLDGFSRLGAVEKDKQNELPEKAQAVFSQLDGKRFFAWVHFYSMHAPYYAGRLTTGKDGKPRQRYRLALRYLDEQVRDLVGILEKLGVADDTIFFFIADHGENLGENRRTGHGGTVVEEEVHVPFAIRIPGAPGAVIEQTVGNIDVLPTALDLIGAPDDPVLRGGSLVPLMADPSLPWERTYMVANGSIRVQGVVSGRQKLFYNKKSKLFYRFDLARDPEETVNIFGSSTLNDNLLLEALYRHNPLLAVSQLDDANRELVAKRLAEVDPEAPGAALPFLLELMAHKPHPQALDAAVDIFEKTNSMKARLAIAKRLARAARKRNTKLIGDYLAGLSDEQAAPFVAGLGRQQQPPFSFDTIRLRMQRMAASAEPESLQPWLLLVQNWNKPYAGWAPIYSSILEKATTPSVLRPLLRGIPLLKPIPRNAADSTKQLAELIIGHIDNKSPEVARSAIDALAAMRATVAVDALRAQLEAPNLHVRVKQATLHALGTIQGVDAVATITELGDDPLLTVDACEALRRIRHPSALPWLNGIVRNHYNAYTRNRAKAAIKAIGQVKKPRPKKK
jgi:hypothetical protein